ncbi:MAG: DUF5110 domain-containing protein [Flavobacteriales bacterium]|nr:DUF5110 domain-containing protein [Flavobacteriales bacterium]
MEGGKAVFVELVEENIPTYVRAGAFIPFAPLVQTTDDYNVKILDVHYYHDPSVTESSGQIYHDDGLTANAYEKGRYEKLHLKSKSLADKLEFELNKEIGNDFSTTFEVINFTIHNGGKVPKKVKTNGKNYDFTFDKETQNITINNLQLNTIQSKVVIDF